MHEAVVTDCAATPPHVRVGHAEGGLVWQLNVTHAGAEHGRDCGVQAAHPAPPKAGAENPTPSMTEYAVKRCVIVWMPGVDAVEHVIEHGDH